MTSFIFLFFGALAVAAVLAMSKIQRQELLDARAVKARREERMKAYRGKCYRPDGD